MTLSSVTPSLEVADLEHSVEFYCGHLGFVVDTLAPADAPYLAIIDHGSVHLMLYTAGAHAGAGRTAPQFTGDLRFELDSRSGVSVDEIAAELEAAGVGLEWPPETFDYGRREMALRDPDGYLLIFSEPIRAS